MIVVEIWQLIRWEISNWIFQLKSQRTKKIQNFSFKFPPASHQHNQSFSIHQHNEKYHKKNIQNRVEKFSIEKFHTQLPPHNRRVKIAL